MDPSDVHIGVLAALAIIALSLIAATLPSTVTTGGMGGEGGLVGSGDDGLLPAPPTPAPAPDPVVIPYLAELVAVIAVLLAAFALLSVILNWRQALAIATLMAGGLAVLWLLIRLLAGDRGAFSMPTIFTGNGSAFGSPGNPESVVPATPPILVLVAIGIVVAGAIVAVLIRGRPAEDDVGEGRDAAIDAAAVGRAAGRAADRIEGDREVENEVFRAWHEMTELLDVADRHAATPGEFADAAIDAGLSPDDVGALTALFEDVRYGGQEATVANERRALRTFRRIEAAYAADQS